MPDFFRGDAWPAKSDFTGLFEWLDKIATLEMVSQEMTVLALF